MRKLLRETSLRASSTNLAPHQGLCQSWTSVRVLSLLLSLIIRIPPIYSQTASLFVILCAYSCTNVYVNRLTLLIYHHIRPETHSFSINFASTFCGSHFPSRPPSASHLPLFHFSFCIAVGPYCAAFFLHNYLGETFT